jgi:hypothetical protein
MRWLTEEWARGRVSDLESDRVLSAYGASLRALAESSAGPIAALARADDATLNLCDAVIAEVGIDNPGRTVTLHLVQGDDQIGYRLLVLKAAGATVIAPSPNLAAEWIADARTEIWYWELEQTSALPLFELRLLLWPRGEAIVAFESIEIQALAREERLRPPPPRRVVVDGTALPMWR